MKTQEVRYLDMADPKNACTSILVNDFVLIPSGTTVYAMPVTDKNPEYNLRLYSSKEEAMQQLKFFHMEEGEMPV